MKYINLSPSGVSNEELLVTVKKYLANNLPSMFGFSVYSCMRAVKADGMLPFPTKDDTLQGGHAVVAVGYDDQKKCLLVRNYWGKEWGLGGYFWMPYDYILKGLTHDFWTLIESAWLDEKSFE
jgi:C1A family cysteine protease